MASSYDAIVIGTGQAGPSLSAELAGAGQQVAVVERHRFGGTCVNVGCTPTKTLVASARAAHVARRAGDFGVVVDGGITVDMRRVKARKDAIVRKSNHGVESWLKGLDNCTVASRARTGFVSASTSSRRNRSLSTSARAPMCHRYQGSTASTT